MEPMDVESRSFKSFVQVPRWWTYLTSGTAAAAFLVAFIAIILAGTALNKANEGEDDDELRALLAERNSNEVTERAVSDDDGGGVDDDAGGEESVDENAVEVLNATPGSGNYTGYKVPAGQRARSHFSVIVHGTVSPGYWAVIEKGIDDAARAFGVEVDYFAPEEANHNAEDNELISEIRKTQHKLKDGLAVSFLETRDRLGRALREVALDLPVLSMLLDADVYDGFDSGAFAHLGFSNAAAGVEAAQLFSDAGVENALCLLTNRKVNGQQEACDSFRETLGLTSNTTRRMDATDLQQAEEHIGDAFLENSDIQGILTIGHESFQVAYDYLKSDEVDRLCNGERTVENSNCVMLATFDVDEHILQGIVDGEVAFALDSQQYLQGYLAILNLVLKARLRADVGTGIPVITGPKLINTIEMAERLLSRNISTNETIGGKRPEDLTVRFIVHGEIADPFWRAVRRGARFAMREFNIGVEFYHPDSEIKDMNATAREMASMIEEAIEDDVDALVLSIPLEEETLIGAIEDAAREGDIPVFTMNTGHRFFGNLSIQSHVGVAEVVTSATVRERLLDLNVTKTLCVIPEHGNADLTQRCLEIQEDDLMEVEVLDEFDGNEFSRNMEGRDSIIEQAVTEYLNDDREITAVISAGPAATVGVRNALAASERFCGANQLPRGRRNSCVVFGAYDLIPEVFHYIQDDELAFAVDSQPALQGYLPVVFAMLEVLWGNHPLGLINTAPKFVDITNVQIEEAFYSFEYN